MYIYIYVHIYIYIYIYIMCIKYISFQQVVRAILWLVKCGMTCNARRTTLSHRAQLAAQRHVASERPPRQAPSV